MVQCTIERSADEDKRAFGATPRSASGPSPLARVLAISSWVARGPIGLGAILPALQHLGHEIIALPTIVLSNHPGHTATAGVQVASETLGAMVDALQANGWLSGTDAVITGYLPTPGHVAAAADAVRRVRTLAPRPLILCDPVLGDDPGGLYIEASAADAIRDVLVPLADIVTPNRFELAWLSGVSVADVASAKQAAARLSAPMLLATSIGAAIDNLANVLCDGTDSYAVLTERHAEVPHGTGDFLAAYFLGELLTGLTPAAASARATKATARLIEASLGRDSLNLGGSDASWR